MNLPKQNMTYPKNFQWLGGLIQTTDTLFPSGGYAHSYGLEEMVALGKVQSIQDLEDFLMQEILPSLEKLELPYLRFSVEAVEQNDLEELAKINEEISAWKITREIRDAGGSQGAQLLRMILEIYQCPISKSLNNYFTTGVINVSKLLPPRFFEMYKKLRLNPPWLRGYIRQFQIFVRHPLSY